MAEWTRERIIETLRKPQFANPNGGTNVFIAAADMLELDGRADPEPDDSGVAR